MLQEETKKSTSFEKGRGFYFLIAPILLVFCLSAFLVATSLFQGLFVFGIAICMLFYTKGKKASCLGALTCLFALFYETLSQKDTWSLGVAIAIALCLFIALLSYEMIATSFSSLQEKQEEALQQVDALQNTLARLHTSYETLATSLQEEKKKNSETQRLLLQRQEELKVSHDILQQEREEKIRLIQELSAERDAVSLTLADEKRHNQDLQALVRVKEEQDRKTKETLQEALAQLASTQQELVVKSHSLEEKTSASVLQEEKLLALQEQFSKEQHSHQNTQGNVHSLQNALEQEKSLSAQLGPTQDALQQKDQEMEVLHSQLQDALQAQQRLQNDLQQVKKQFLEKSETLDQTRKDLFKLEGQCLALQKEREFHEIEIHPSDEMLSFALKEMHEEAKVLEDEVESLQEIISKLLVKKKAAPRKKKEPKKKKPSLDLELDFTV